MQFWRRTLFAHLFLVFSVIILVAIGIFSAINYASVYAKLSAVALQNMVVLSRSLVINIDTELQNMDRISKVPIFSRTFQDLWQESWTAPGVVGSLVDLMSSVNGTIQGIRQIYLYNLKGEVIGIGGPVGYQLVDVRRKPWYPLVTKAAGDRIITGIHPDPLIANLFELDRDRRYISLCRGFTDYKSGKSGVIEIEHDCAELFQYLDILSASSQLAQRIVIIADDGTQIYPYDRILPDLDWIVAGRPQDISIQVTNSHDPRSGQNTVLMYTHSLNADWSLVLIQDEEHLFADVPEFAHQMLIYAFLVSLAALVGSFWTARRVSIPLKRLSARMTGFSLEENQPVGQAGNSSLAELEDLNQAFGRLTAELRHSFAEAVLLRAHKHRAQLLALQAQMNPHFMFNMLANISVMAEGNQATAIPVIVEDLAEMMRYIASSEEGGHTLKSEFDFIRRYLQSMKHRFPEDLQFQLDCPETMAGIAVPRLVLQPFIENAIKYTTRQRPPWILSVCAEPVDRVEGLAKAWQVTIEDNGPGFQPELLAALQSEINRIKALTPDLTDLPDLHVEGMGMTNTFVRLKLNYGDKAIMEIGNRPDGGAFVQIGGSIDG